jgi:hypothetical protein
MEVTRIADFVRLGSSMNAISTNPINHLNQNNIRAFPGGTG